MAPLCSPIPSSMGAALLVLSSLLVISCVAWSHPTNHRPHYRWGSFQNFSGCSLGDQRAGLAHLKRYLHRFGYLPTSSPADFSDHFDHELQAALLTYQHNFHLNSTGTLDTSTISHLSLPRCGVADIVNGTASWHVRGRNLYSFFPGSPTWPPSKRDLTYTFTSTQGVSSADLPPVFARAFARWSDVTSFSFTEAESGDADITIGFFSGNHGDGEPFDGRGHVLAHSFAPTDGRLHVDADEDWVVEGDVTQSTSEDAMDLESVMVHEIGHILGLGHSLVMDAIMYPTIGPRTRKVELANDDIQGIQTLYGGQK